MTIFQTIQRTKMAAIGKLFWTFLINFIWKKKREARKQAMKLQNI